MLLLEILLVTISIFLFTYSAYSYKKIYQISKSSDHRLLWTILFILVIFFFFGYLLFDLYLITDSFQIDLNFLISQLFFFGATFIALSSHVLIQNIKELNSKHKELTSAHAKLTTYNKQLKKDVKERTKKLEESFSKSIVHEKEIQKLKDEFVFVAAHELRSPVNAIRWNVEMIKDSKGFNKLVNSDKELLENVESSNQRLINLVDDLLDVARIEYGTFKVKLEKINLNEVIKEVINEQKYSAKQKQIKITYTSPKEKIFIKADLKKLKEVIDNILNNAIKYNKTKGTVKVAITEKENKKLVEIKDNGYGINATDLKKIFSKFFRSEDKHVQNQEGTGLGLFISKQIVKKMKGSISAQSAGKNKGTTFLLSLPKHKE
ncbi:MAG: HAMP domain-containing sensor histidine kinase [bacterium]|nr:HAMP domain-containing sensor histidine kinase [bacterium]